MKGRVVEVVTEMVGPMLENLKLDLVEVKYQKQSKDWVLSVTIDRPPEGVSIDDLEKVNRALSEALDTVDIIDHAYMLEVSSPGAERKLKDFEDLKKQVGRYMQVTLEKPVNGKDKLTGYLRAAEDDQKIVLENEDGMAELSYSQVTRARLAIKF
ncbi:MAG: ribosome maturation factor RimP [Firmicutes bacterium]|nr:ribosome maturation factor RimP [Bacillota bacterium]MDD4693606.1 ribosome maturation factor RimP [Bacillota bacterium]